MSPACLSDPLGQQQAGHEIVPLQMWQSHVATALVLAQRSSAAPSLTLIIHWFACRGTSLEPSAVKGMLCNSSLNADVSPDTVTFCVRARKSHIFCLCFMANWLLADCYRPIDVTAPALSVVDMPQSHFREGRRLTQQPTEKELGAARSSSAQKKGLVENG